MASTPPSPRNLKYAALAWAICSQAIWLPLLVIDTQERFVSKNNDYHFSTDIPHQDISKDLSYKLSNSIPDTSQRYIASKPMTSSGIILNTILPEVNKMRMEISPSSSTKQTFPIYFAAPKPPKIINLALQTNTVPSHFNFSSAENSASTIQSNQDFLNRMYRHSELLGGEIKLEDLNEPLMPPMARAERAKWSRSGDPLAPIPDVWRESMRKALSKLSNDQPKRTTSYSVIKQNSQGLNSARVVHVPSQKIKKSTDVPLALQSDGSVDILSNPDDPQIVEEIKSWSTKQQLPAKGQMTPAIVHLHPLPSPPDPSTTPEINPSSSNNGAVIQPKPPVVNTSAVSAPAGTTAINQSPPVSEPITSTTPPSIESNLASTAQSPQTEPISPAESSTSPAESGTSSGEGTP